MIRHQGINIKHLDLEQARIRTNAHVGNRHDTHRFDGRVRNAFDVKEQAEDGEHGFLDLKSHLGPDESDREESTACCEGFLEDGSDLEVPPPACEQEKEKD